MTRDYTQFLSPSGADKLPKREPSPTEKLGCKSFFSQQKGIDDMTDMPPVRVVEVHRTGLYVLGECLDTVIRPRPEATVGDWLLYDQHHPSDSKALDCTSVLERRAVGSDR
ncbi:hypothetical protein AB9F29_20465 [Falsihalocynthiibacter sp. S25ZX9]|uniref:hypothetical protein n=1 Tax=Falsihalocynthiibacter sp. S25ZX9 TaxID=3240870 RepID=UPI00350F31DD